MLNVQLVTSVLCAVDVKNVETMLDELSGNDTVIRIHNDGLEDVEVSGTFAVCRYFGRLWRLYPTTPTSALLLDSALDRLQVFVLCVERESDPYVLHRQILDLVCEMNDEMFEDTEFIGGMHMRSICDIMYHATLCSILSKMGTSMVETPVVEGLPKVSRW
jgi:hypothetical protein